MPFQGGGHRYSGGVGEQSPGKTDKKGKVRLVRGNCNGGSNP